MIAVPPWVLGAIVLLAGCGFISAITEEKEETAKDTPTVDTGLLGVILCCCGIWVLWIGPNPEPPSAWIAIALGTVTGAALGIKSTSPGRTATSIAIVATSGLMAATFILRASLPGFE